MGATPDALPDKGPFLWRSGRVASPEQLYVPMAPKFEWQSAADYFWTVRYWDENDRPSGWADPVRFGTGLLDPAAWSKAQWISSAASAPSDEFVKDWESAALLDRALQKPATDADGVKKWHAHVLGMLSQSRSPVVFRKPFQLDKPVKSARLFISGLGYYHASANGKSIGDFALAPSISNYDVESRYNTFDVAGLLEHGRNSLEIMVAPGRLREKPAPFQEEPYFDGPLLRVGLIVTHTDGTTTTVLSDDSWQAGIGPVRRSAFWVGEAYDATKPASDWRPVEIAKNFSPRMRAEDLPPQRVVRELTPVSVTNPQPGVWVYDFGGMTVGKAHVQVPPGAELTIRYSELLRRDVVKPGLFYAEAPFHLYPAGTDLRHPGMILPKLRGSIPAYEKIAPDHLLLWGYTDRVRAGADPLDYMAFFDYTGFRYVEITGIDHPLPAGAVKAAEIHNDFSKIGTLKIADPRLQAVADAATRTILLNTQGIYQDNPGAERAGSASGNAAFASPHAFYNFDNRLMLRKALEDARQAAESAGAPVTVTVTRRHTKGIGDMLKQGKTPGQVPITVIDAFFNGITLIDAVRFYGDRETSSAALDNAAYYFECLLAGGFPTGVDIGDHMDFTSTLDLPEKPMPAARPTDPSFVAGCVALWQGRDFLVAARFAGRDDLVRRVEPLLSRLRQEIDKRHLDPPSNRYALSTSARRQGADALTILLGLRPKTETPALLEEILADIRSSNGHQTTGLRLTAPLFSLLAENGHIDEAARLTTRATYPSPFATLAVTGGTLSETWGAPELPAGCSFVQTEGIAASANWIYEALVGITPMLEGPGFSRFRLAPVIPASVSDCDFSFDSPRGRIESSWKRSGDSFEWKITVPPNAIAEIILPDGTATDWTEDGKPLAAAQGIRTTGSRALECASGTYFLRRDILKHPKPQPSGLGL